MAEKKTRPIYEIAREIEKDWGEKINIGAIPYLVVMQQLTSITDKYMSDGADEIVRYFLSNASTWKGETARRVKKELNEMLKHNK